MWSNVRKSDSIFHGNIFSDSDQSKDVVEVTGSLFEQQLMLQLAQDQNLYTTAVRLRSSPCSADLKCR